MAFQDGMTKDVSIVGINTSGKAVEMDAAFKTCRPLAVLKCIIQTVRKIFTKKHGRKSKRFGFQCNDTCQLHIYIKVRAGRK